VIVTVADAILPEVSVTKKGIAYIGAVLKLRGFERIRVPLNESIDHVPLESVREYVKAFPCGWLAASGGGSNEPGVAESLTLRACAFVTGGRGDASRTIVIGTVIHDNESLAFTTYE